MIISVATDNEFWVGPLILLIPLPIPVIVASGAAVLYTSKGIWKLFGFKGEFDSFLG